jgi:Cation/multidrug efflux pump
VLSSIARIEPVIQDNPIYTRDQHPVVYVTGDMLHSSPVYGVVSVTQALDGLKHVAGVPLRVGNLGFHDSQPHDLSHYQFFWLGEMRLTLDVFRDLGTAFLGALLLIYLLLVGYYRSFFMPLVVMGAIPLTLIGVFPGHWLMHQPFTATSMIGVIALAGIVVRNSLLLIDFIVERRRHGYTLEAAVMEAGAVRLRPILLTALAIILGSAIMLTDPVFGGLAISLIFGAFASTVLTLFVIPLAYFGWQRRIAARHAAH